MRALPRGAAGFWRSRARSAVRPADRRRRPRSGSGSSSRRGASGRTSCRCGGASDARARVGRGRRGRGGGRARRLVARAVQRPRRRERACSRCSATRTPASDETADGEANLVVTPTGRAALVVRRLAPAPRGQGLRDLGLRGRCPAAGGHLRAARRRDALAAGRARADGRGHARAGRRRRRADRRAALHRRLAVVRATPLPSRTGRLRARQTELEKFFDLSIDMLCLLGFDGYYSASSRRSSARLASRSRSCFPSRS